MRALLGLMLLATSAGAMPALPALEAPFQDLVRRSAPAMVRVAPRTEAPMLVGTPVSTFPTTVPPPSAGFAVAKEWVIAHLGRARKTKRLSIATTDGKLLSGTVKARVKSPPLVLIHVPGASLEALPVGPTGDFRVGSWAMILGNAFGTGATGGPSATLGLVSARREVEGQPTRFVLSAAANPGDAGGAVLDRSGRVVGIVTGRRGVGDMADVMEIEAVLAALGPVEGFEPRRADAGPRELPVDAVSRHIRALADGLRPSIVSLVVRRTDEAKRAGPGPVRDGRSLLPRFPVRDGAVSGFLVDDRGTILTSYVNVADVEGRLVDDAGTSLLASVEAVLADGRRFPARLVGAHEGKGIAVLRIEGDALPAGARLGQGRALVAGRWLLTMGDPTGEEPAGAPFVGFGIVADQSCEPERYDAILTDAPVNTATVGGPVVDMRGAVIGISIVAVSPKDSSMRYGLNSGIGFVIPIEDAMALVPRVESEGVIRFRPGFLGVRLEAAPEPDGGVRISNVIEGTGAERAGLKAGDVILRINDLEVGDGMALRQVLFSLAPGTKVLLAVQRGDDALNIEVTLTLRPDFPD